MRSALQDRDPATVDKYTWTRPKKQPAVVPVSTYAGVKKVLSDDKSFISASDTRLLSVTKPFISSKKLVSVLHPISLPAHNAQFDYP